MSDVVPKTPRRPAPDPRIEDGQKSIESTPFDETLAAVTPPPSPQSARTLDGVPLPSSPASPADVPELRLVDPDNYSVSGEIAQGGIGRIYRARDERLDRPVALKELLDPAGGAEQRFVREALVTARLQHPGIVPIYEAGRWPSGEPFYAMKLVSGRSFAEVIDETRTLDQRLALLPHVLAVTEAMAYAHGEHIIHRDLKPANILIGDFGETVVIDWGLAKDLRKEEPVEPPVAAMPRADPAPDSRDAGGITLAGAILGTPAYMPPEQASGQPVDARADVYALGALLYHLLAGVPPYNGSTALEVLRKVLAEPPPPLPTRQTGVPLDLVTLVDKAMARDPTARYATAKELSEDLRRFQTGQIVGAHHYSRRERLARFARRYRAPLAVALSALVVLAALGTASVRRILEERRVAQQERDRAEEQRDLAARRQAEAEQAHRQATERADKLTLVEAGGAAPRDPNEAIAWLKSLSPTFNRWGEARLIAADADSHWIATVLRGHKGIVNHVAWSPDSRSLATFSDDRRVRVWGVDGKLMRTLDGHEDEVWRGEFSPDGKRLASGSKDGTIRLWDLATGAAKVLRGQTGGIFALHFSPDGRHLVSKGQEDSAWLWDLDTNEGSVLPGGPSSNWPAIFSPDGNVIAYLADNRLFVVSLTGAASKSFPVQATRSESMAFSPDASSIVFGSSDGVWLIDPRTGAPRRLYAHARSVSEVAFFPTGGAVASAGKDADHWSHLGDQRR